MASTWNRVWITGASTGIGRALALRMSAEADTVWASARSGDALDDLSRDGANVVAKPLDITDNDAVTAAVADMDAAGGVDLAVLNAGAWKLTDVADLDLDAVRKGVEVNIVGTLQCAYALIPGMIKRGKGHIAIVASVAGYRGLPRSIAYGPTKAALINAAETMRTELAPRGITVSVVNPGFVDTPMTADNPFPMPQLISPEAAADAMMKGLRSRRFEIRFPWRFTTAMKALRLAPNGLFFAIMRRVMSQ